MTRRLATIWLVTVFLVGIASLSIQAQDDEVFNASLKGISAVFVWVEPLPSGAKELGLSEEIIQTDVELKLRLAGMRVVKQEEGVKLPGSPYVYVRVTVTDGAGVADINVNLRQNVLLARNRQFALAAETWSKGFLMVLPTSQRIRVEVKDLVDKFLNAWLSVNSKK
jgi:hypothetical protein